MSEENLVTVRPLRSFLGEEGDITPQSPPFQVTRQRAADLKANRLVEIVEVEKPSKQHAEKQAAEPDNKQAAEPKNKAASAHDDKSSHSRRS
jgi:hypothetical protein